MTATLQRSRVICRAAFIVTLLVFLTMAAVLVGTQLAGVVFMQPDWVTWAADHLLTPSITAGVAFGLVGFISGYVVPTKDGGEE